ncbi:MAG: glycosyltransferase [Bacteroidota bacterium]
MKAIIHKLKQQMDYLFIGMDQMLVSGYGFLSGILLTKIFGLDQYGLYVWIWLGISFMHGLQYALIHMPLMDSLHQIKEGDKTNLFSTSLITEGILNFLTICLAAILLAAFGPKLDIPHWLILCYGSTWLAQDFARRIALIDQKGNQALFLDTIAYGLPLASLVFAFILPSFSLTGYILTHSFCLALSTIIGLLSRKWARISFPQYLDGVKLLGEKGVWMVSQHFVQFFSGNLYLVSAGVLFGDALIGALRLAQSFMGGFNILFLTMESIVPIKLSEGIVKGKRTHISFIKKLTLPLLGAYFSICVIIYAVSPFIVEWIYEGNTHTFYHLISGFCALYFIIMIGYPLRFLIRATGNHRHLFFAYIISSVFCVASAEFLVKNYEWQGVIGGMAASQLIMILYFTLMLFRDNKNTLYSASLLPSKQEEMTIIHIILGKARKERMNGVSKVAHNLALAQTKLGLHVELWGITPTPNLPIEERPYQLRLFQAKKGFKLDHQLKIAVREAKDRGVVFHIHGAFIPEFYTLSQWLKKHGISYIYCPHGAFSPVALRYNGLKKKIYFNLFEKRIIQKAHCLQFLGPNQFGAFDQIMKVSQKRLLSNGQNIDEIPALHRPSLSSEGPIFTYCGRLINHYKAIDIVIAGFNQYLQLGGTGKLWIIGDGPDRAMLEKLASHGGYKEDIHFWGPKYGEEKFELLSQSHAFVHPSHSEGFPTGVLEAAAMGLPCIISKATNFGPLIQKWKRGVLIEAVEQSYLTEAFHALELELLAEKDDRKAKRQRKDIAWFYNWDRIADISRELYKTPLPTQDEIDQLFFKEPKHTALRMKQ